MCHVCVAYNTLPASLPAAGCPCSPARALTDGQHSSVSVGATLVPTSPHGRKQRQGVVQPRAACVAGQGGVVGCAVGLHTLSGHDFIHAHSLTAAAGAEVHNIHVWVSNQTTHKRSAQPTCLLSCNKGVHRKCLHLPQAVACQHNCTSAYWPAALQVEMIAL